jgi:hypothetical protein
MNGDSSGKDRGIESRYVWVYDMYECVSRYVCICIYMHDIYICIYGVSSSGGDGDSSGKDRGIESR